MNENGQLNTENNVSEDGLSDDASKGLDRTKLRTVPEAVAELGIQRTRVYNYIYRKEKQNAWKPIMINGEKYIEQEVYDHVIAHFRNLMEREEKQNKSSSQTEDVMHEEPAANPSETEGGSSDEYSYEQYITALQNAHAKLEQMKAELNRKDTQIAVQERDIQNLNSLNADLSNHNTQLQSDLNTQQKEIIRISQERIEAQSTSRTNEALYREKAASYDDLKRAKDQMIEELKSDKERKDSVIDRLLVNEALREMNLGRLPLESLADVTGRLISTESEKDKQVIDAYIVERKEKVKNQIQEDLEESGLMEQLKVQSASDIHENKEQEMKIDAGSDNGLKDEPQKKGLLARIGYRLIEISKK